MYGVNVISGLNNKFTVLAILGILGFLQSSHGSGPELYRLASATDAMAWALDIKQDGDACLISLKPTGFRLETNDHGVVVTVGGDVGWPNSGEPRLPTFPVLFQLREDVDYEILVDAGEAEELHSVHLLPVVSRQSIAFSDTDFHVMEVVAPNTGIYEHDAFWPPSYFDAMEARGMGRRYLRVSLHPFQYNPLSQILRSYPGFKITVNFNKPTAKPE